MNKKLFKLLSVSALITSVNFPAVIAAEIDEQKEEDKTKSNISFPIRMLLKEYCKSVGIKFDPLLNALSIACDHFNNNSVDTKLPKTVVQHYYYLTQFIEKYKENIKENDPDIVELLERLSINESNAESKSKKNESNFFDNLFYNCVKEGYGTPEKKITEKKFTEKKFTEKKFTEKKFTEKKRRLKVQNENTGSTKLKGRNLLDEFKYL